MLCPRCAAENPKRAIECTLCGYCFHLSQLPQEDAADPPSTSPSTPSTARPGAAARRLHEDRLARLMREARDGYTRQGRGKPTDRRDQEDDILRELVAGVFEINRRIKRQKGEIDHESLAALYTARSFASPEAMGRTTAAIHQLLDANRRIAGEIERVLARIRGRVEAADWTFGEKTRFWREIASGFTAKFELRTEILEKQKAWSDTTIDLYEFVLCHSDELSFEGKAVRTSDREAGEEFVRRLKQAKQCRDVFRAAAARNEEIQAGLLTEWGTADSRIR
jgi:hypothetical protein